MRDERRRRKEEERREISTTKIWDLYEKGKDQHTHVNMYDDTEREYAFYEGDQWRYAKTGGEELPVLNIIKPVVKYKVATIAQNTMAIVYSSMSGDETTIKVCEELSKFAASQWEKMKMDTVAWDVIKRACITGDHYAYFFDASDRSGGLMVDPVIKLGVRLINKTNVYFSDEQNPNIDEQEWIIISERIPVDSVKKIAKDRKVPDEEIEKIVTDDNTDDQIGQNKDAEVSGTGKCTSLLYMSVKEDGLHFCRSVKSVVYEPEQVVPIKIYPLAGMRWETKVGDSRGLSAVKGMIANQLEINKTAARRAIAVKRYSYPTLVYDMDRVANVDDLDTVGAKIAIENLATNGVGSVIQYLSPAAISNNASELQNEMIALTQQLEGAGDAALGQVDPEKTSGEAIKAARDAAAVPLNEQYAAYKQFVEDVAMIWYRLWVAYSPAGLFINYFDGDNVVQEVIEPAALENIDMMIRIDVSPIDPYSRLSQEASLGNLLAGQYITFEEYVEALSDDSGVPKAKLKKILDERKAQQEAQMQQIPPEMMMQEQMVEETPEGGEAIDLSALQM